MPKFVIEREIPGAGELTEAERHEADRRSVKALRELGPQIQWLHSYITDNKVCCVYLAPMKKPSSNTPE
jgi:Nickel responsive protein SCO4226-like